MRGIFWFLILWAACSLLAFGQESEPGEIPETGEETSFTSLHKSLLFPGWGQFAEKRYLEGIFFSGAELFCLIEVIVNDHKGNKNYKLYKQANTVQEAIQYRELTEKFDTRRNQYLLAATGVWIVNLIDIFFIMKKKEKKPEKPALSLFTGEYHMVGISFNVRF